MAVWKVASLVAKRADHLAVLRACCLVESMAHCLVALKAGLMVGVLAVCLAEMKVDALAACLDFSSVVSKVGPRVYVKAGSTVVVMADCLVGC